jgi:hypothetical protein
MDDGRKIKLPTGNGILNYLEKRLINYEKNNPMPKSFEGINQEQLFSNFKLYEILIMKELITKYKNNCFELSTWNHIYHLSKQFDIVDVNQYDIAYNNIESAISNYRQAN